VIKIRHREILDFGFSILDWAPPRHVPGGAAAPSIENRESKIENQKIPAARPNRKPGSWGVTQSCVTAGIVLLLVLVLVLLLFRQEWAGRKIKIKIKNKEERERERFRERERERFRR
jgi:hypothetical protein